MQLILRQNHNLPGLFAGKMADTTSRFAASVSLMLLHLMVTNAEEPICSSRFDNEYKVVEKLVYLEQRHDRLMTTIEAQKTKIKSLQNHLKEMGSRIPDQYSVNGSGIYTRWGRTTCPGNGTEIVYDGYAAGSSFDHKGAAASFLCLPAQPTWASFTAGRPEAVGLVYGAEYQLDGRHLPDFFGKDLYNQDAPCVLCSTIRANVLMIPGRNSCFSGWTLEYKGYLISGNHMHESASEYICLDGQAEVIAGSKADTNGKLMYFSVARCGTLKCPPYVDGRELACVVCSK